MLDRLAFYMGKSWRVATSLLGPKIHLVPGGGDWIFNWIAKYIYRRMRQRYQKITIDREVLGYHNQLIHFISRYSYLRGQYRNLDKSNRIFVNWFHGDFNYITPDIEDVLNELQEAAPFIEKVIISCKSSRNVLRELGVVDNQIINIPLGVDLEHFVPVSDSGKLVARQRLGIPSDGICIGCFQKDGVGWADGYDPKLIKGPDIFLEVIANLLSMYDNLFIVLTGPARGYVKQGLDKLNAPYIHRYLQNYHEIVAYYHTLDLLVIPSRREGGPSSFLESWATGIPVVSTRVGMPEDYIRHGENGMLADVEDVDALVSAVRSVLDNRDLAAQLVRNALVAVKEFDWNRIADRYYDSVYSHVSAD